MTEKDLIKIDKEKILATYIYEDYYFDVIEEWEGTVSVWVRKNRYADMKHLFNRSNKTTKKCMKGIKECIAFHFHE